MSGRYSYLRSCSFVTRDSSRVRSGVIIAIAGTHSFWDLWSTICKPCGQLKGFTTFQVSMLFPFQILLALCFHSGTNGGGLYGLIQCVHKCVFGNRIALNYIKLIYFQSSFLLVQAFIAVSRYTVQLSITKKSRGIFPLLFFFFTTLCVLLLQCIVAAFRLAISVSLSPVIAPTLGINWGLYTKVPHPKLLGWGTFVYNPHHDILTS